MESIDESSNGYYRLYEKIALVSLLKREMSKTSSGRSMELKFVFYLGNLGCITPDTQTKKKKKKQEQNVNNNNNILSRTTITTDETNQFLHFYVFNLSRERNLHLSTHVDDKRLLIFQNISNSLQKIGLRNGENILSNE